MDLDIGHMVATTADFPFEFEGRQHRLPRGSAGCVAGIRGTDTKVIFHESDFVRGAPRDPVAIVVPASILRRQV